MKKTRIPFIVILVALGPYLVGEAKDLATVRIHATDQFGKGLAPVKVMRFIEQRVGGHDYADRFVGSDAKDIPYGDYVVTINAANIRLGESVHVSSPDIFLVLSGGGLIPDFVPGANPLTRGIVLGLSSEIRKPVWVRIINLYWAMGSYQTVPVGNDGTFTAGLLLPGSYFLATYDGEGMLFSGIAVVKDLNDVLVKVDLLNRTITAQSIR